MAVDEVVETLQATLIVAVMGVVLLYLNNRELGSIALDILPGFIQVVVYFFLVLIVAAVIVEQFD